MSIFVPPLILGIYTMLFFFYMGLTRRKAVMSREMNPKFYLTYSDGEEPPRLRLITRHTANLLETPMLFYTVVVMIHVTGSTSSLFVGLAWAYAYGWYTALLFVPLYNFFNRKIPA